MVPGPLCGGGRTVVVLFELDRGLPAQLLDVEPGGNRRAGQRWIAGCDPLEGDIAAASSDPFQGDAGQASGGPRRDSRLA